MQAYATMQEAESQVMKYTGMAKEQVADLNEELKKMDTRTPREQLNALAGDAGRLGITTKEAVLEYVDAADKINVALGEDLGEDATKNIAKLAQMFGEDDTLGLRGAMLATGSTVNTLGQKSAAAESFLVQFTARVGGAAHQAKIAQTDILGFAAAMDENMLREETSATAYQKILMKMYTDTDKFASAAGIELSTFSKLLKEDANEALLQFAEGLSKKGGLADLAPIFGDLKTEGAGVSTVLSVMAGKADEIREHQKLANEAYREGTSILAEFEVQNGTVQAGLDKAKKHFAEIGIKLGEQLLPIMTQGIHLTSTSMKLLSSMISFMVKYSAEIAAVSGAIAFYTAWVYKSVIADKLQVLWKTKVVTAFNATTAAAKKLWASLAANPWIALAAGIAAAGVAIYKFVQRSQEAKKIVGDVNEAATKSYAAEEAKIRELTAIIEDNNISLQLRKEKLEELQSIVPGYHASLTEEGVLINNNTEAITEYLKAKEMEIRLDAILEKKRELMAKRTEDELKQRKAQDKMDGLNKKGLGYDYWSGVNNRAGRRIARTDEALAELDALYSSIAAEYTPTTNPNPNPNPTKTGGGGGGGGTPSDDAIKAAKAELQRQAELQKMQQRLLYESGQVNQEQYAKALLDIDAEMYAAQRDLYANYSVEWLELENKRLDTEKQKRKESNDWSMADIERQEKEETKLLKEQHAQGIVSDRQYQEELTRIKVKYLRRRAEEAKKWGQDARQYEEQAEQLLLDDQLAKQREFLEKAAAMREEYTKKSIEQRKTDELALLDELYKKQLVSEEEYQRFKKQIEYKYAKEGQGDSTANLGGSTDDLSQGVLAIGDAIDNLNAKLLDGKAEWEDYAAIAVQSIGMINAIMGAASQYMEACYDAEAAAVEARYDKEIEAAGGNQKKIKAIEKRKQDELAELKTKYNERAMAIEIAQAVASTAMAAINAYASAAAIPAVGYILGPIAAAAALAAGGLQIATIKKQHQAEAAGYYSGGFTGGRRYRQVAGVVHEGEFVANHEAVNNPNVLPILNLIDQAQRNNTVGSLTAADVSRSISAPLGTAAGVQAAVPTIQVVDSGQQRTAETIDQLNAVLAEGIRAVVAIEGPDGIHEKYTKYQRLIRNKKG
ncbi:MAG: phage tail tape measure protein [Bacteroidaceae bacterium]|nr:phage tail tape measure protein [Bacteroidaceae bacterium]